MLFRVAIVPDFSERYDRSVVDGISHFVHETDRWRLYVPPDPEHRVSMLGKWSGDGIIANFDDPKVVEQVKKKHVPAIGFGGGEGYCSRRVHYMATDNAEIGRLGARHLLDRGLIRFGFCTMPLTRRNQPWSEDRARAFQAVIKEEGLPCSIFRTTAAMSSNWTLLLAALCRWLQGLHLPVGIMAAYDLRALHVLEACRELGLKVPHDVAVLGVDNDEQVCELGTPTLSSIEQGGAQLGYHAAELLDHMMKGNQIHRPKRQSIPPVGVVTRRSTDVLAIDDDAVTAALQFIHDHACEGIRVGDIMKQVSISRVSLENRFKSVVGHTMHCEIKRVQLAQVKHLLRSTDLSIRQIADRTGFEYSQYLSNLFRRMFDQTLGEYRKDMRGMRQAGDVQMSDH